MTEDPFLFLPNMLCLVQQSEWLLHRAGPLTRRPSLRPNINCQSPVNRNCFYNLAVHLLEGRGPQSSPASHRQECKSRDKERLREKDKEAEIERKTLWSVCQKNLAYLCLYSSPLLKSPTSSSATFSSSVHLCRGKKKTTRKWIIRNKWLPYLQYLIWVILSNKLMSGMQMWINHRGGESCLWTQIHLTEMPDRVSHSISHPKKPVKTC